MEEKDKFRTVHELKGEDIVNGVKDIYRDVVGEAKRIAKKGKDCRVLILDKKGKVVFRTPLIAGAAGMAILFWVVPLLSVLATLGVLLTEHTIRIEEAVEEEKPVES